MALQYNNILQCVFLLIPPILSCYPEIKPNRGSVTSVASTSGQLNWRNPKKHTVPYIASPVWVWSILFTQSILYKYNRHFLHIQCVSVDSASFVIYPETKATEVNLSALKWYLCSFYFRIDNEAGWVHRNTLYMKRRGRRRRQKRLSSSSILLSIQFLESGQDL